MATSTLASAAVNCPRNPFSQFGFQCGLHCNDQCRGISTKFQPVLSIGRQSHHAARYSDMAVVDDSLNAPIFSEEQLPPRTGLLDNPQVSEYVTGAGGEGGSPAIPGVMEESSVNAVKESVNKVVGDGQEFFNAIQESLTSSLNNVGSFVTGTYEDINSVILNSIKSTGDTVTNFQSKIMAPSPDLTSPFRTGTAANNSLKELIIVVKTGLNGAVHLVLELYTSSKSVLPPEVRSALDVTEGKVKAITLPVAIAFHQAFDAFAGLEKSVGVDPENPVIPVILFFGGSVYLGLLYWQIKYGGYSGDLSPDAVLEMLNKEKNIALIDLRPQELKEIQGIPDLRRGARFKFSSLDLMEVERPVRNLLKDPDNVDIILTAAIIRNLKNVKPSTKVIVMDADGSSKSKKIARALRKAGIKRSYRMDGGFNAWTKYGLRQKSQRPETPLTILKEETEAIVEEVKPTPAAVVLIAVGSVAGIYALYEWEKTLQLLGVLAIVQVLYQRFNSYQSFEDLKSDITVVQKPFKFVLKGFSRFGKERRSSLELATSPSSTAVRDRVLQAAAKHGPLPSQKQEPVPEKLPDTSPEAPES